MLSLCKENMLWQKLTPITYLHGDLQSGSTNSGCVVLMLVGISIQYKFGFQFIELDISITCD